jgi:hypothetical protein
VPENPIRQRERLYASARCHEQANPGHKKAAFDAGVTTRTERRWRTPTEAQGSPPETFARYVATAQDPWRALAFARAAVLQRHLERMNTPALLDRIHELHAANAGHEGEDNATRAMAGVALSDRAVIAERDGATDLELAACYREAASRQLSEADIFDRWSPR